MNNDGLSSFFIEECLKQKLIDDDFALAWDYPKIDLCSKEQINELLQIRLIILYLVQVSELYGASFDGTLLSFTKHEGTVYVCVSDIDGFPLKALLLAAIEAGRRIDNFFYNNIESKENYLSHYGLEYMVTNYERLKRLEETTHNPKPEVFTYVMEDGRYNVFKIGRTMNLLLRENTLSHQYPFIKTILKAEGNLESFLHRKFEIKKIRGEWFNLTQLDLEDLITNHGFKRIR